MLVLTRKMYEKVILRVNDGTVIKVIVVGVNGKHETARLGFEAPANVKIDREEIDASKQKDALKDEKQPPFI